MEASILVGLLLIAGVWGIYLFPTLFGGRDAPINSTEEFDNWTHVMNDVQKRAFSRRQVSERDVMRNRRRRVFMLLGLAGMGALFLAWTQNSWAWLMVNLFFDALIILFAAAVSQMNQRKRERMRLVHVSERTASFEEPQIRVIAN